MLRDGAGGRVAASVASCGSCLAWGLTYSRGACLACYNFAARNRTAAACGACGRAELLKRGHCRLCWCQAALERTTGPNTPLAPWLAGVRSQQLFFAGMSRRRAGPRAAPRRRGARGRPPKPPPPPAGRPPGGGAQLALFDAGRGYRYGRVDLRSGPPPGNPWLAWALHLAHARAEASGFDPVVRRTLNRSLVMLLADHREGDVVRASDFHGVLRGRGAAVGHAADVLRDMGVLADDRPDPFDAWLEAGLDGLAPGIASAAGRWARELRDGGPRARPRAEATARAYARAVRPALLAWSARYGHLREVTRDDASDLLGPLRGRERQTTAVALRSLFAWARRNGVVFANPASRLRPGRVEGPVWQPLLPDEIARTVEAADTPQARVFVALAAVHAARPAAARALRLDDVDLANRRLTVAGHARPLDDLTRRILTEWLDHRRARWPHTANPHLLVTRESALGLGEVSGPWVGRALRGLPATLERLRIDRQLEEALASGADPLHVAAVFGISASSAIRYAASARSILAGRVEADAFGSAETQAPATHDDPPEHLGSR